MSWLLAKRIRGDLLALALLTLLWGFYFWRILTPNMADQVSFAPGDFSGQFYAFGSYQAERILAGEVPLWNPYNYAGHPFLADTQSAVFYPPRLITIVVSNWLGGWSLAALQYEAIFHFWLSSIWMYFFVRTITKSQIAGMASAIIITYGGYLTGYPPLQLAVLEAGIWFPLSLLGVYKASTGKQWGFHWLAFSSLVFGLSLLAGHPQTSLFFMYALMAYIIHRAVRQHYRWAPTLLAVVGTIGFGFGVAAVQILPGFEYIGQTYRTGQGFDWRAGGFPWQDLATLLFPNVLSHWSPLYSGIGTLVLVLIAANKKINGTRFWLIVCLISLALSLGGSTIMFDLLYLLGPGFGLFRGQERAAFMVAHSLAIMAGLGVNTLLKQPEAGQSIKRLTGIGTILIWIIATEAVIVELASQSDDVYLFAQSAFFSAVMMTLAWLLLGRWHMQARSWWWAAALIGFLIFDLFSATMGSDMEPITANERTFYNSVVDRVLADDDVFRVDGRAGLGANYGTLVGLEDIRGISPLEPAIMHQYFGLPQYRLNQILNVKYVFTDWVELEVPSTIVATDAGVNLHELSAPLPRAWMVYQIMLAPDEAQALGWLADSGFDPRNTAIVTEELSLSLPQTPPDGWDLNFITIEPEHLVLEVNTPEDGLLVLSEIYYPGWYTTVNNQPVEVIKVNAGLRGLLLPAGSHRIAMHYRPISYKLGVIGSLFSLMSLVAIAFIASRIGKHLTDGV